MTFPTLKTSQLLLRQITEHDLQNIYSGLSNPEVIKYYGVNYKTLEETWEQLEWYAELERTHSGIWWAITSIKSAEFYGAIGFHNISRAHKKAELGFWLLPEFWGKGIIQIALKTVTNYAFQKLHLHRIEAFVETENLSIRKTLQKCHFQEEGILRDSEIKNGRFISVAVYAKLNDQFSEV